MFQGIDINIDWMAKFLSGGSGLAGIISAVALIITAIRLQKLAEITVALVRLDKTMEENTDATIENTERIKKIENAGHKKFP